MKKSLSTLEAKRKDELRDRDRRIAELERQVQLEQKRRESSENKVKDSKRTLEEEAQALKTTQKEMEIRLHEAQSESQTAKARIAELEFNVGHREAELLQQLEQHRHLLASVARQYGALANRSVLTTQPRQLKLEYAALRIRQLRLDRKLANSEGQVVELTHLVRQVKEDNNQLKHSLRDAHEEISFHANSNALSLPQPERDLDNGMRETLEEICRNMDQERTELLQVERDTNALTAEFYRLKSSQLCFAASVFAKEQAISQNLADQGASDLASTLASHEAIAARLESVQKEKIDFDEKLALAASEANDLRASMTILEVRLVEAQQELHDSVAKHTNAVKKDKDAIQRLSSTIQKSRVAEEALRGEIELSVFFVF